MLSGWPGDVVPQRTRAHPGGPRVRVDLHTGHPGGPEQDDIASGLQAGRAVAGPLRRDTQTVRPCETHDSADVLGSLDERDRARVLIGDQVPRLANLVPLGIGRTTQLAGQSRGERVKVGQRRARVGWAADGCHRRLLGRWEGSAAWWGQPVATGLPPARGAGDGSWQVRGKCHGDAACMGPDDGPQPTLDGPLLTVEVPPTRHPGVLAWLGLSTVPRATTVYALVALADPARRWLAVAAVRREARTAVLLGVATAPDRAGSGYDRRVLAAALDRLRHDEVEMIYAAYDPGDCGWEFRPSRDGWRLVL